LITPNKVENALFCPLKECHAKNSAKPTSKLMRTLANIALISCVFLGTVRATQGAASVTPGESSKDRGDDQERQIATIKSITRDAMKQYNLKALIVQVSADGREIYTDASGESMSGVPATPSMHFRNGAMAFTYISTMLLELVDQKKVSLDDKLSKFLPNLPHADRITLKNLANMTSGYADYVYEPEVTHGIYLDPFRQWTPQELIKIGVSKPMMFKPGTNWGYCHTNYVILGRVLEQVTHMSLAQAMRQYILDPMDLKHTQSFSTPQIPEPVLHTFSSERRSALHVPAEIPFYEESTFWNPSWTTAEGAIQTTDITDMSKSMEAVGTGKLLTKESLAAQVNPNLVGFGKADPHCPACHHMSEAKNYGLGVVNLGPWVTQTKSFAGCGATVGYLPSKKLAVAVAITYTPKAFDHEGSYENVSEKIFSSLGNALAPGTLSKPEQ
jgi:CubicO group peptidase (beta-lactamase class C family)